MGIFIILLLLKGMLIHFSISERHGGLVVGALDSGSRGPGSSPGRVIVLCSWARHCTLTAPLSTQGNLMKYWG